MFSVVVLDLTHMFDGLQSNFLHWIHVITSVLLKQAFNMVYNIENRPTGVTTRETGRQGSVHDCQLNAYLIHVREAGHRKSTHKTRIANLKRKSLPQNPLSRLGIEQCREKKPLDLPHENHLNHLKTPTLSSPMVN